MEHTETPKKSELPLADLLGVNLDQVWLLISATDEELPPELQPIRALLAPLKLCQVLVCPHCRLTQQLQRAQRFILGFTDSEADQACWALIHLLETATGSRRLLARPFAFPRGVHKYAALTTEQFEEFKQLYAQATTGALPKRRPRVGANTVPAVVRMLNFALLAQPSGPLYVHTTVEDEHPGRKIILEHKPRSRHCTWTPEFCFLQQRLSPYVQTQAQGARARNW